MTVLERAHLSLLREVDRRGSLTAAAAGLGLTQSALSHTVRKIEEQLGIAIWERQGRGLRLTTAGSYLLGLAQRVLPQLEHAEHVLGQLARGERGTLRIGMECHPCYQWLLKVVEPYLRACPDVDLDVKQKFQFGGIGALFAHEIDMLVTPDPLRRKGLHFEPVFDYEQVLVVGRDHAFAQRAYVVPAELEQETLITYPVEIERLDVYTQFLLPAGCVPKRHKVIETTDIMLQMVASGRGVAALPGWLVAEYAPKIGITAVRLGRHGVAKQIFLGVRASDTKIDYISAFVELARTQPKPAGKNKRRR
ncbi:MAG TPA: LysR family transcriptional regulator [Polyangiaceae bacterium]|nr:LysR family transcriptional regulator [Polyangiaceae bacterium]